MKKKIATLLMFLFSCLSIFTGCNLFDTNNYAGLNSIVATSGEIEITREQLINAYNSSGYYYDNYYGYTREEAMKKTIDDLVTRQYLINHVEELEKTDSRYKLTDAEKYEVIKETWNYIDTSIESIVESVKKDLNLSSDDLTTEETEESTPESEYAKKEVYTTKFVAIEVEEGGEPVTKIVKRVSVDNNYVPKNKTQYDYELKLRSSNKDYETIVWNRYITALKRNQKDYNYKDTSDTATFNREIDRVYKTNLENAKLKKFENTYKDNYGFDYFTVSNDGQEEVYYYVNDVTLQKIVDKYNSIYQSNKELYDLTYNNDITDLDERLNTFYKTLTNSTERENYFYYGSPADDEELITCMHILVKLTQDQEDDINLAKEDPLVAPYLEEKLAEIKSQDNTYAYKRTYDEDGVETISTEGLSVTDLYNQILSQIRDIEVDYTSDEYVNEVVKIFDEKIYEYNQDSGIINAKFDYVVGTKTSAMVESFTEAVRTLYNNGKVDLEKTEVKANYDKNVNLVFPNGVGYAGAISAPFLQESENYKGYHIVLYTGTLQNTVADKLDVSNVYSELSKQKTSIAYGQNLFELIYEKITKDTYSTHQQNIIDTFTKGTQYNTDNFKDMF